MRYYLFYNENEQLIGWLETPNGCTAPNAKEVDKETYLQNGGCLFRQEPDTQTTKVNVTDLIVDAFIE